MEKVLNIILENEEKTHVAINLLKQLDRDYDISLGEYYVVSKNNSGKVSLKSRSGEDLELTALGSLTGGLVGIMGGPAGVLFGLSAGALFGMTGDFIEAEDTEYYLNEIAKTIPNEKSAVIAHVWEGWEAPVNSVIEKLNAQVTRYDVQEEFQKEFDRDMKVIDDEIEEFKNEIKTATQENKANIEKKLSELKTKRDEKIDGLKQKMKVQTKQIEIWEQKEKKKLAEINENIKAKFQEVDTKTRKQWEEAKSKIQKQIENQKQKLEALKEKF